MNNSKRGTVLATGDSNASLAERVAAVIARSSLGVAFAFVGAIFSLALQT